MYLNHWNLREQPFQNQADPRFAYLSEQHQEALARLVYVVRNRKLGSTLTGTYGVGKSMLLELLACHSEAMDATRLIQFDAPPDGVAELARAILGALDEDLRFTSPSAAVVAIRARLANPRTPLSHITFAIDEAQDLRDPAAIEFLHRLTNLHLPKALNRTGSTAFTLILSGLPELHDRLAEHKAFRQRLTMNWNLAPLDQEQTIEYVSFRMRAAGGDSWVFEDGTLEEAALVAGGLPRLINNICDAALMLGFAIRATRVNSAIMRQAIAEVLQTEAGPESPAPAPGSVL